MTDETEIRQVLPAEAEAFRAFRLAALTEAPAAFSSDAAAESRFTVDDFAARLGASYVAGAFEGEMLIAVAGFRVQQGEKTRHRGDIWGVYVAPDHRARGLGRRVMEHLLSHARGRVEQVHLGVAADNEAALTLYEDLGFVRYGTEPRALKVGGRYLDEHLMVLQFR